MTDSKSVLLWSQSQCAFHIESVQDMVEANLGAFADDRRMDYVPLVFGTYDECSAAAEAVRHILRCRQESRSAAESVIERARAGA